MLGSHGAMKNDRFGMTDPIKSDDSSLVIKYIHLIGQNVGGVGKEHLGKLMEVSKAFSAVLSLLENFSGEFLWLHLHINGKASAWQPF